MSKTTVSWENDLDEHYTLRVPLGQGERVDTYPGEPFHKSGKLTGKMMFDQKYNVLLQIKKRQKSYVTLSAIYTWFRNLPGLPNRLMAYWLRSRGWVVFYLDEQSRHCSGVCWLEEYKRSEKHVP